MRHGFTFVWLAVLLGAGAARAATGDLWYLQQIVVVDKLDERAELIDHYADHYGGHATIRVDGALGNACPGDSATMNFNWSLDVDDVVEGAFVPVGLFASPNSAEPCSDKFTSASYVTVAGSNTTLPPPLSERTMKAVDKGRFVDNGTEEARATPKANVDVDRNLLLVAYDPVRGKAYAYFQLRVVIPGSERELRFAYVFSKGPPPDTAPSVGVPPPPPG